ncbi:ThiF family adenylyltransferase [Pedobacter nototheniae]|uniref:ThiF family adenylyltransferase n=1 Tax=Pedobacter nototheniae TaxID=2488994 RepID=UPI002930D7E0|nr:ThiF family adenylyltransferase [Pedobacter nototheniae]
MDKERYQRQTVLKGFGEVAQTKLAQASVLVIGAGGLGCPALQYLVAAGIGKIGIADDDRIELSNLQRQVLFTSTNIGELKVEIAAKRLKEMNPDVEIVLFPFAIDTETVFEVISNYDIILDGTDNFKSRYIINDACTLAKKPLVFAAVSGFEGQLAVFNTVDEQGFSTNYRDLFPVEPIATEIPNCAENGVLGVLPGILGTMAAGEIIKHITGIGKTLANKLLQYNLLNQEQYEIKITPSSAYKITKVNSRKQPNLEKTYLEIDAENMLELAKSPLTILVDVREKHEFPRLDLNIYRQAPMSDFGTFVSSEIEEENIILICQHGIRSVAAAELLHEKYGNTKTIYSLKGGISKWRNHFATT